MWIKFLLAIIISAAISAFFTPQVRRFFVRHHWVEDPKKKDLKTQNATATKPVPRGGGLPIFLGIFISTIILLPPDKHLLGILLAAFLSLVVGLWDDVKDISPKLRLVANIVSALIVVASGIGIAFVSNPFGGVINLSVWQFSFNFLGNHSIWVVSDLLALIWIIWCMNIVGWASGIEGQLPGFTAISAFFIGILALKYSTDITQWPVIILAGAVSGAYLGFLPFNFYPQSIMPGYSGKSLAGFFLAVLAILSGAKLATVILLLGVPMLDAVFTIFRRIKEKKPVYLGDGRHFHHNLLKLGWSRRSIAIFYWSFSLVLGVASLALNSQQKFYVFTGLSLILFSLFIGTSRRT
jgi:UDP-GlcNAc:undecaprenyl-phosphate GlcNAc-1-phosphate transferase